MKLQYPNISFRYAILICLIGLAGVFGASLYTSKELSAAPIITHYWIGSSGGNWSDTSNWSLTSGGASCGCVPGTSSIAGFIAASSNNSVTVDTPITLDSIIVMSGYSGQINNGSGYAVTLSNDLYVDTDGASIVFGSGVWDIADDVTLKSVSTPSSFSLGSATIYVGGDWKNQNGTVTAGTSTVELDGSGLNQNVYGSTTFYNFVVDPDSTKFIGFESGTTTTYNGSLTLTGADAGNKVHIQTVNSSGIPVQENANIAPQGSVTLSYVTVQYNSNTGPGGTLVSSFDEEVVEIVPFSTSKWFPTRGPAGLTSNIETWLLADAEPYNKSLEKVSAGDTVRRWDSIFGGTVLEQTTESAQPTYRTNVFNFNPALDFDAVNDFLHADDGMSSDAYYLAIKPNIPVGANMGSSPSFLTFLSWRTDPETVNYNAGGFTLGGEYTSQVSGEVITHSVGGGTPNIYRAAYTVPNNQSVYDDIPHVFAAVENAAGDFQDLFANGLSVGNDINDAHINFKDDEFWIGSWFAGPVDPLTPAYFLNGQVAEVLSFNVRHNDATRQKVLSYLALKYGVTLDQSGGGQDYIASDAVTYMWDDDVSGASSHDNDIAGIGQDNASALYQPKSRSVNKDSIVTIGDPEDLENMEFLTWGNDNGDVSLWTPFAPIGYERIFRTWQAQEEGDLGPVNVFIDPNDLPNTPGAIYMFTDTDTNFMDAEPHRMVLVGDEWQLETNYDFSDGEYFSFGYKIVYLEFEHSTLSGPENNPPDMTRVFVKGELISPISFQINDLTQNLVLQPKATADSDYTYANSPQLVLVPAGDYRTTVYPQSLNISIVPDSLIESDEYVLFSISNLPSTGVAIGDVDGDGSNTNSHYYIIANDDSANVLVSPVTLDIGEGSYDNYTVVLTSEVQTGEIVVIDVSFGSELETASGSGVVTTQVTFDETNWNIPQSVAVWAVDDDVFEGNHTDIVTHAINTDETTDPNYLPVSSIPQVDVTIWDNDTEACVSDCGGSGGGSGGGGGGSNPDQGCMDGGATEYTSAPGDGPDGVVAVNYDPSADEDDGSCIYVLGEIDPPGGGSIDDALSGIGECPFFSGFYKLGSSGPVVARWQAFLNVLLGSNLIIDGNFGPATDAAVREYHEQWADVILVPWGHKTPTGYIYKTTNATGNSMIGCPLGTVFISETGKYFNADTYNSNYNLQALTQELRNALNIQNATPVPGYQGTNILYPGT